MARKKKPKHKIPQIIINGVSLEGSSLIACIIENYCGPFGYREKWKDFLPPDILSEAESRYQSQQKEQCKGYKNAEYRAYINSPEWKQFRKYILSIRNRCEMCGDGSRELHIHHKTYENFMHEYEDDVQVLCYKCHEDVHGRKFALRRN